MNNQSRALPLATAIDTATMSELHEALSYLSPMSWDDVPKDDLGGFLSKCFSSGELLCNTVPPIPNGTPFESAKPHFTTPNTAKAAKDIHSSSARPFALHKDHEDLRKSWGKPMKFSHKENPLDVALYKMAGHDRHGQWYARHSVEEGLGFAKFKKALMREFPESMLVEGPAGAGAKRGLSAERRVEKMDVDGVGTAEVYQMTAQMPPPVTPREFLTLFMTTDHALTTKSGKDGGNDIPRHFMILSRPLTHPDAPNRASFVRGQYESVELIREIPLPENASHDPELNPVEWTMVTRSDPAGGVPRFLVDRGTPGAMLTDVTKFLDWACGEAETSDSGEAVEKLQQNSERDMKHLAPNPDGSELSNQNRGPETGDTPQAAAPTEPVVPAQESSMMSNLTQTLQTGVEAYAPAPVANFVHIQLNSDQTGTPQISDSSSDSSSINSFMSAEEMKQMSTAPETLPGASTENVSIMSATSSGETPSAEKKNLSSHDKEVLKIMKEREKLDHKLAKKRQAEEDRLKQSHEKEESEQNKARERMEKEIKKTEERHRKEVEKLEARREKELKKAEERKKKRQDHSKLSQVARERDEFRTKSELLAKENELLRDQVETIQRENTALASRLGKLGGQDALKSVQDEIGGRSRVGTMKSTDSISTASGGSSEKKDG